MTSLLQSLWLWARGWSRVKDKPGRWRTQFVDGKNDVELILTTANAIAETELLNLPWRWNRGERSPSKKRLSPIEEITSRLTHANEWREVEDGRILEHISGLQIWIGGGLRCLCIMKPFEVRLSWLEKFRLWQRVTKCRKKLAEHLAHVDFKRKAARN